MSSDPRFASALDLARRIASLRAAEDWVLENMQAAEDGESEEGAYYLTVTLRWRESAPEDEESLRREII